MQRRRKRRGERAPRCARSRGLLLACALLALPAGAGCERQGAAAPSPVVPADPGPPRVPDDVLTLLPPGLRPPAPGRDPARPTYELVLPEPGPIREQLLRRGDRGGIDLLEIEYSLDRRLDALVRQVLRRGRIEMGQVVILDVTDGRVLAYVSTDPAAFPVGGQYPTASLMKVITAAAVLRNHPEAVARPCRYVGDPHDLSRAQLQPPKGGRVDSFWRAFAISNNQCFARNAVHDVGREALLDEIARFGLLEAPGPGHGPGRVDPVADDMALGELGSGLAGSFISPLAAARIAAVLAEGQLVHPYWLARVSDGQERRLALPEPEPPRRVLTREIADELRTLGLGVTQRGSAKSAFRDHRGRPLLGEVKVSGKTGSLNGTNPDGRYEWFIGVAPADEPRIAIAAVVVNGERWWRHGSQIAADVLYGIFCGEGPCQPEAATRLAAARDLAQP